MFRLVCVDAVATDAELLCQNFPVSIGRGPEADITINDSWASRRHCEIHCDESGCLTIRDLDSRNGTRVNGELIREAALLPGDELTVGISTFLVATPSGESSVTVRHSTGVARDLATA